MTLELTSKQTEFLEYISSGKYTFGMFGGAIRGGKTYCGLSILLILCRIFPNSRWAVIRENNERIRLNTIPSFKKLQAPGRLKENPYEYKHPNGSVILFLGENYARDKDLDWMKGLEVNGFLFEEIQECQQQTLYKAFERAGAWIIPNTNTQPNPLILATANPSFTWVKELIYDKWKRNELPEGWVYVPSKITDNPHLPQAYKDNLKNLPKFEYEVFVEGNWDIQLKTGGEYYHAFELEKHTAHVTIDERQTLHVSIDSNMLPYIAITTWQIIPDGNGNYELRLIQELPQREPNNTARKAGIQLVSYLKNLGYTGKIYMYGDRSTKNGNNIDDERRSFYQIFTNEVTTAGYSIVDKILQTPSPSKIGDFVNAIFSDQIKTIKIIINQSCKEVMADMIETKTDKDGSMLAIKEKDAKGRTYDRNTHFCFIGETLILTKEGYKRIDNITKKDYVLTRKGYRRVVNVFYNGKKEVSTYKIGGNQITCTPDHKIWTKEHRFISIKSLINEKTFCIFDVNKNKICKQKLSIIEIVNSYDIQTLQKEQKEFITQDERKSTEYLKKSDIMYTNTCVRSVKFLKVLLFTIKMKILSIMKYLISNAKTDHSICTNICRLRSLKTEQETQCLHMHNQQQAYGMELKKVGSGTLKTMINTLEQGYLKKYVKNAVLSLRHLLLEKHIFVAKDTNGNTKLENKEKNFKIRHLENAKHAEKKHLEKTIVRKNVIIRDVYDIEVDEVHEYFANNILVSNCDNLKDIVYQAFTKEFNEYENRFKPATRKDFKQVRITPKYTY